MAEDRTRARSESSGESTPRGDADERIRGVSDEDQDEFEDTEDLEDEEDDDDEGTV